MADAGTGVTGQTGYIHVSPASGVLRTDPPPPGSHRTWPVDCKRVTGIYNTDTVCVWWVEL